MNSFNYIQAKTLKEASSILKKKGAKAAAYAGGTDVLGLMKDRIIEPEEVVNLKSIDGLTGIKYDPLKGVTIGALTTVAEIAESTIIAEKYPILQQAAKETASPQLRNMGTVGGNICQRPRCWYYREDFNCMRKGGDTCFAYDGKNKYHCVIGGSPCFIVHPSDLAVVLTALNANLVIFSDSKSRSVPVSSFFVLPENDLLHENILKPGEIITEIIIPAPAKNTIGTYVKFKERDVWDFAVVSAAVLIHKDGGKIASAKVVLGGVAPIPWSEEEFNESLKGLPADEDKIKAAVMHLLKKAEPLEMNAYKIPLARNLTKRLLLSLLNK